jgi:hypothetical protein
MRDGTLAWYAALGPDSIQRAMGPSIIFRFGIGETAIAGSSGRSNPRVSYAPIPLDEGDCSSSAVKESDHGETILRESGDNRIGSRPANCMRLRQACFQIHKRLHLSVTIINVQVRSRRRFTTPRFLAILSSVQVTAHQT